MIREVLPGPLIFAILATVAVVIGARTPAASAVLFASTVCVAACATWWLLKVIRRGVRQPEARAVRRVERRRRGDDQQLKQLVELERIVASATYFSADAHARLRPLLRGVASDLLAARRGVNVDADSLDEDIAELLGAHDNPLLGPLVPGSLHGMDRGPSIAEIGRTVDLLEAI
jgi:hypothetical protein